MSFSASSCLPSNRPYSRNGNSESSTDRLWIRQPAFPLMAVKAPNRLVGVYLASRLAGGATGSPKYNIIALLARSEGIKPPFSPGEDIKPGFPGGEGFEKSDQPFC